MAAVQPMAPKKGYMMEVSDNVEFRSDGVGVKWTLDGR